MAVKVGPIGPRVPVLWATAHPLRRDNDDIQLDDVKMPRTLEHQDESNDNFQEETRLVAGSQISSVLRWTMTGCRIV